MRGWWRGNRFWLPLVPVALVAMLAASSYHVKTFWYDAGLRRAVAAAKPGAPVDVDIPYTDALGRTAYRFSVRLEGLRRLSSVTDEFGDPVDVPDGTTAYGIRMRFSADPSVALRGCQLTVVDSHGRQYDAGLTADAIDLCVPAGHEGPSAASFRGDKRGQVDKGHDRPERWTAQPVVFVKDGVRPTEVRLWFARPDYVALRLR